MKAAHKPPSKAQGQEHAGRSEVPLYLRLPLHHTVAVAHNRVLPSKNSGFVWSLGKSTLRPLPLPTSIGQCHLSASPITHSTNWRVTETSTKDAIAKRGISTMTKTMRVSITIALRPCPC